MVNWPLFDIWPNSDGADHFHQDRLKRPCLRQHVRESTQVQDAVGTHSNPIPECWETLQNPGTGRQ